MPRPCSICRHPERQAIDQALAAKEPYRNIAERFETSPAALHRHQQTRAQPPGAVLLGAPPSAAALVDTAHRVHASACLVQSQTRDLRSVHAPELGLQALLPSCGARHDGDHAEYRIMPGHARILRHGDNFLRSCSA